MTTLDYWKMLSLEQQSKLAAKYCFDCGFNESETLNITDNIKLLTKFSEDAHIIAKKCNHYAARTIIEVLRHNDMIADNDPDYKINNNIAPFLAKISMLMFPALNALFSTRVHASKVLDTLHP